MEPTVYDNLVQKGGNAYTNFADLQPENTDGQPDCGSFYMGNPNLYWETYNCFKEQGFVCKIQAGQELKDTSHTEYKGCKPGWVAFKDPSTSQIHCYLFDHTEELPWVQETVSSLEKYRSFTFVVRFFPRKSKRSDKYRSIDFGKNYKLLTKISIVSNLIAT